MASRRAARFVAITSDPAIRSYGSHSGWNGEEGCVLSDVNPKKIQLTSTIARVPDKIDVTDRLMK
jgi:hypothetical protein